VLAAPLLLLIGGGILLLLVGELIVRLLVRVRVKEGGESSPDPLHFRSIRDPLLICFMNVFYIAVGIFWRL
jgi:hypothetical protein